ncbi:MAG: alanine--tRNA ligase [Geodermatophilaceae bacterium]|nr:alanine--tRNA ligase [Geodermatophilaceae bacterium]MDQ3465122.1 alanine--tRNA ligase [Actinomycetota bacterium]
MRTADIRRRFLEHFTARGHTLVPSASLIAADPTLMFTVAGMVPFIPYLTGREPAPYPRAVSVQKCVRTLDIEEVGKTTRHGTFFQMNGNFSFGDYFKEGAISYAWELVTGAPADGGLGFDPDRIWVTVYKDDDEAARLWPRLTGLPEERVQRLGMEENYWSTGQSGPAGPCSEIFFDRGPAFGPDGGPAEDKGGDRFLEFWNLVFMQYERGPGEGKDFPILRELPSKNIDTGMGLERVAYLLQGVDNLYEIDEVRPVLDAAASLTTRRYGSDHDADVRLRVIADHVRTGLMLIGDGVIPSNEGRGYVLRRILRRAVRAIRLLGYEDPAFPVLFPVSRDAMTPSYPELATEYDRIAQYAYAEEEAFGHTLRQGTTMLDVAVRDTKQAGKSELSGERAFALHDTFGFPIDLTLEMAAEQGLSVDEVGFRQLMNEQRSRAKADSQARKSGRADVSAYTSILAASGPSEFTGYVEVSRESRITGLLTVEGVVEAAGEGDEVEVILDATPFYAEGGGQQPDWGVIRVGRGELEVIDVQTPLPGVIVHRARVVTGEVHRGDDGYAEVDVGRRRAISRAHTATHLIHRAMRGALGESAAQAGSLNAPGRLRFDFTTPSAVPPSVLADVQDEVNAVLLDDLEVRAFVATQAEARRIGALALFGEKYGDEVRVVEVGDYARELCGGTHAARSGQLGMVQLLSEASIGAGVRRVEALVGMDAFRFLAREHVLVSQLAETFKVPAEELPERVHGVLERLRQAEKELEKVKGQAVLAGAGALATAAKDVFGVAFVGAQVPNGLSAGELRTLALDVRGRLDPAAPGVVVLLGRADDQASGDGRVSFVVAVNEPARAWKLSAAEVVRAFAPAVDGRGGGREDMAQGAGGRVEGSAEALRLAEHAVAQRVTGSA